MKAAFLVDKNKFQCQDAPMPSLSPGESLVAVQACGICGSDVHDAARAPKQPRTPGHEFAGIVEDICGEALGFKRGESVVINPLMCCEKCAFCLAGQEHLCGTRAVIGCQTPGGFADYAKVPTKNLRRIPKGLRPEIATLGDPLAVVMHGCDLAGDLRGKNVLVFGAGTLGQFMIQVLKLRGAAVVAVSDIAQPRLNIAAKLGPTIIVDAAKDPEYEAVKGMTFDVCVELAGGQAPTLAKAITTVRRGGLVLLIAQRPPTELNCAALLFNERRVQGVFGQTGRDFNQAIELLAGGKINGEILVTDTLPLDQMQEAFDRARSPTSVKVVVQPGPYYNGHAVTARVCGVLTDQ